MKFLKININNFFFYLIISCLIVFSINFKILHSFRILDIILLCFIGLFILTNPKINKQQFFLFILIIFCFLISCFIGFYRKGFIEIDKLAFIYKYLIIFLVPWLIVEIIKTEKQIKIINFLLLIQFIFLSSWAWIYVYLNNLGFIQGHSRASFPSSDFYNNDSHLFSSYLSFFLVTYFLYLKKFFQHKLLFSFLIIINGIIGLLMTGSRTGILLVFITFIFFLISKLINFFKYVSTSKFLFKKKDICKFIYNLITLIFLIIFFYYVAFDFVVNTQYLFQRSLYFDLYNDQSSNDRIYKLRWAINEVEFSGWLFGNGLNADMLWYDGIFSMLLAHGGLIFILFIFIFYYFLIKKKTLSNLNENFLKFKYLFFLYLLSNVITEYVFVSRNSFPVLIMLSILYLNSSDKKFINLRH